MCNGELVVEYCGELLDVDEFEKRIGPNPRNGDFAFRMNKHLVLDAKKFGSISRFINHSCDPNCVAERWVGVGGIKIGIFAGRDIKPGEEITFDYKWASEFRCQCGVKGCKGRI